MTNAAMTATLRHSVRVRAAFMLQMTAYPRWLVPAAVAALVLFALACLLPQAGCFSYCARRSLGALLDRLPTRLRFTPLGRWLYHCSTGGWGAAPFLDGLALLLALATTLPLMRLFPTTTCEMEEWTLACFERRVARPAFESTARALAWAGWTRQWVLPVRTEAQCQVRLRCVGGVVAVGGWGVVVVVNWLVWFGLVG
jgi:hypothetical protein